VTFQKSAKTTADALFFMTVFTEGPEKLERQKRKPTRKLIFKFYDFFFSIKTETIATVYGNIPFLDAPKHLYNWLCSSVGWSVCWSATHRSTIDTANLIGLLGLF